MKKKKFDPFKNLILDDYEQEIEDALERGEFVSDPNFKENKKIFEEAAKRFIELEESKSITLRVKKKDLMKLKAKAAKNNIAYQTLINLLINNYNEGKTKINL
jgi:predicted DNA binding CopG/RHH family protein